MDLLPRINKLTNIYTDIYLYLGVVFMGSLKILYGSQVKNFCFGGTRLAQSGEHAALDLRAVSTNPTLSVEIT